MLEIYENKKENLWTYHSMALDVILSEPPSSSTVSSPAAVYSEIRHRPSIPEVQLLTASLIFIVTLRCIAIGLPSNLAVWATKTMNKVKTTRM